MEVANLNELQDEVGVFAVELGGEALETAAQTLLVHLHQPLALLVQLHAHPEITPPETHTHTRITGHTQHIAHMYE